MTLGEYAITHTAYRLVRRAGERQLTDEEWRLLEVLSPVVNRIEGQQLDEFAVRPATGGRAEQNAGGGVGKLFARARSRKGGF